MLGLLYDNAFNGCHVLFDSLMRNRRPPDRPGNDESTSDHEGTEDHGEPDNQT